MVQFEEVQLRRNRDAPIDEGRSKLLPTRINSSSNDYINRLKRKYGVGFQLDNIADSDSDSFILVK